MRSMTGFGRGAASGGGLDFTARLRSVNHRFLDVVLRGGEETRALEPEVRERLGKSLHRGRVELNLEWVSASEQPRRVGLDLGLLRGLRELGQDLEAQGDLSSGNLTLPDLLRVPGVVQLQVDTEFSPEARQALLEAVDQALEQLVEARSREGEKLTAVLADRLDGLASIQEKLVDCHRGMGSKLRRQLEERLEEVLGDRRDLPDENRLAQEVALLVDRSDVREELDRLATHLEHGREIMAEEGSLGKRLDFLAQEIFRELNTIASKCRDSAMTRLVLDGKVLCEQLREQIQNIE